MPLASSRFDRFTAWLRPIAYLGRNPTSLTGAVLTTTSAITVIAFWVFEIMLGGGAVAYPYAGILFFLILPSIFVHGLILIPVGSLLRHRSLRVRGELPEEYPRIDFNEPVLRKATTLVAAATFINVVIFTTATYRGAQYMDSVQFCGTTCHTVMQPEFTAYNYSPHSHVACVECHIGPGATWFVRAKLSGVRQVFGVAFHDYPTPIPAPVRQLRPANATCEDCHAPQRFIGKVLFIHTEYSPDETNTPMTTVLSMKVGGKDATGMVGIHGHHLDPGVRITYIATDAKRQVIPQVTYTAPDGKKTVYNSTDAKPSPEDLARGEHRVMDCLDCHNRPTHKFQLPDQALDQAMSAHFISTDLPYIKKEALEVLKVNYPDREMARERIADSLRQFYSRSYPQVVSSQSDKLNAAIQAVQGIYSRNVFPQMNVTWGTYIDDLGHTNWPGCFRCHDGNHVSADGKTIPNDCDTCHDVLAMQESKPKILEDLAQK